MTLNQLGPNVVLSGSGTANLTALVLRQDGGCPSILNPVWIQVGTDPLGLCFFYGDMSGPTSFPLTKGGVRASSSGGDAIGLFEYFGESFLSLSSSYVSGSALAGTATFSGTTLSALGATPGTYVWTWGSGPTADSLTLQVAPEPSTIFTLGGALLGIMAYRRLAARRTKEPFLQHKVDA